MARRFVSVNNAPLRTAVVGYGYWGPNLVRNVMERPELEFAGLCDRDAGRAAAFSARYHGQPVFSDLDDVLADDAIDALVVATPPRTHHAIVRAALEAGKHVLVEKPLATTSEDAIDLLETAARHDRTLMPGHTFVYSPPVNKIKELISAGTLGEVYFVTSSRMNLGKYQADGVICDLAPHDLSILLYWLDEPVVEVAATGRSVFQAGVPETAFITLTFASGANANIQVSWLAPRKVREMTIVGSSRMVQYDDTAADEAVRVFDRGMEFAPPKTFGEYQLTYRSGDMVVPRLEAAEPLSLELADFARAIRTGAEPRSNAQLGLEIVLAMEAAEESLRRNGEPIAVENVPLRVAA
ncbi:Gfo/Idh/MocA family protein [Candidatus Solirubrobacter pratensis]|uniref:Gfo/Idh/MocA family protein n=1 Tax=Candidatus Solirubrobacter pratensis TaxID=1298857 RepID=UPI000418952E|nr:Gfo/Idh/MocA family oxidoreductase [Candidatus Solirubrobacter pratensis]